MKSELDFRTEKQTQRLRNLALQDLDRSAEREEKRHTEVK